MAARTLVLYQDRNTVIHHRDPRVKVLLFLLLFVFLFVAPSWEWLLVAVVLGLILAMVSRTPWQWICFLWAIHLPTFLVLLLIPAGEALLAGNYSKALEAVVGELRLILAWTAAIVISVSLFSTVDPNGLTKGLRGIGFPAVVAFAVGLTYRLLYATLNEAFQIADAMRMKGVELDPKHPLRLIWNSLRISLPLLFAVLRRGPTLMSALKTRGFSKRRPELGNFDLGDIFLLLIGVALFGLALGDRIGVLPFSLGDVVPV